MLRRETSGQAVVSFITHSFISFIWSILRATALSMCGSEPWKTIHTPTPKPISTRLFLVHFIHIPRLRLVPMWGTTSRYPTQTAAFIITSCCLATDKGSEFCGGKERDKRRRVGKQIKSNGKDAVITYSPQGHWTLWKGSYIQFTMRNISALF